MDRERKLGWKGVVKTYNWKAMVSPLFTPVRLFDERVRKRMTD
jgi:hypothetical protein